MAECRHCRSGPQTYRYRHLGRKFQFDVDLAREIVTDGREPMEIDDENLRLEIDGTKIYPEHLPHVDVRFPGIISHVWFPMEVGEADVHGHLLIDGNHRAAKCLQLGVPFFAHILTEDESRRILLESPARPEARSDRDATEQSGIEAVASETDHESSRELAAAIP